MLVFFLGALLFQLEFDPVRTAERAERALRAESHRQQQTDQQRATQERRDFEARFNALARAVDAFTSAYNAGQGHVWPQKEARGLAKALCEMERTSTWRQATQSVTQTK